MKKKIDVTSLYNVKMRMSTVKNTLKASFFNFTEL